MKPRVTIITIGVDDLDRSLRFYRDGLGLASEGVVGREFEYGAVPSSTWTEVSSWPSGRDRASPTTRACGLAHRAQRRSPSGTTCRPRQRSTK